MLRKGLILFLVCILLIPLFMEPVNSFCYQRNRGQSITKINQYSKRYALVIGNASYEYKPLKNPINDSKKMATTLRTLGFEVTEVENLNKSRMQNVVTEFKNKVSTQGVALFYYSGHGSQVDGKNYLIAVDAVISSKEDFEREALAVDFVIKNMVNSGSQLNIIILDACRSNPFSRTSEPNIKSLSSLRSLKNGLSAINVENYKNKKDLFIAYATSPDDVAEDGFGRNSPYTEELIEAIKKPGLKLEDIFKLVNRNVLERTSQRQRPWQNASLTTDFFFVEGNKLGEDNSKDNEASKLIGVWQTTESSSIITFYVRPNGTTTYFFQSYTGQTNRLDGTWRIDKDILYETTPNGFSAKGYIKWLNDNEFVVTIIDNGNPADKGRKRLYRRL